MKHRVKSLSVKVDSDKDAGMVEAVFSTFGVIDHDGDLTLPGAFDDGAPVAISGYNHASWGGALPVGKGYITTTDTDARMVGEFFLNTSHGRDTFETVKQLGQLGEWSYGFDILSSREETHDGDRVMVLEKVKVFEVSPVLRGAGIDTRTVTAKGLDTDDLSDAECAERAVAACKALLERGLTLPSYLVEAVRKADAEELKAEAEAKHAEELKAATEQLRTLAAIHGIDLEVKQDGSS